MQYLLTFLEGIITFVSPCLLPMLPVYVSYFAGGAANESTRHRSLYNSLGFVLGFTVVFVLLGAAAGTFGQFVHRHEVVFSVAGGLILILFGLNFMNVLSTGFLNRTVHFKFRLKTFNFFSSFVLGLVFAVGWTPCVGAFLGSALMFAANSQQALHGIVLLLLFSLGLGIPFVLSAVLIDRLKTVFDGIRRHGRAVGIVSGLLLIAMGVLMMFGRLGALLSIH